MSHCGETCPFADTTSTLRTALAVRGRYRARNSWTMASLELPFDPPCLIARLASKSARIRRATEAIMCERDLSVTTSSARLVIGGYLLVSLQGFENAHRYPKIAAMGQGTPHRRPERQYTAIERSRLVSFTDWTPGSRRAKRPRTSSTAMPAASVVICKGHDVGYMLAVDHSHRVDQPRTPAARSSGASPRLDQLSRTTMSTAAARARSAADVACWLVIAAAGLSWPILAIKSRRLARVRAAIVFPVCLRSWKCRPAQVRILG